MRIELTRPPRRIHAAIPDELPPIQEVSDLTDALDTIAHPSKAARTPLGVWQAWLPPAAKRPGPLTDC